MSMPEIKGSDGTRLATWAEGPEGAPAVLFIHGWAQQSVCWRPVMDRLKDRFRVVAMDLRGHGASDKPEGEAPYTDTSLWADDVTAVIEGYGLEKPVLVGWSYGSRVIASYLSVHSDAGLSGVVLAGGILTIGAAREDWMVGPSSPGVQRDLYTDDLPRRLAATAKFVKECTAQPLDTQAYGELVGANMLCPPHVRRALFAPTWDFRPVYAAMTCPGLVIHGVQDEVVSAATGEAAAKLMQDARYLPYDGTGHAPFLENPDRFTADVANFTETRARRKEAV